MLIHAARSLIAQLERKPGQASPWLKRLLARRNKNIAAVALAEKKAGIPRALLAHERRFGPSYVQHLRPLDRGRWTRTTERIESHFA